MICTILPLSCALFLVTSFVATAMFLPLAEGLSPRCDLEHLFCDARLTCLVRGEREVVDQVARRVRRVAHGDHLRRERGRLRLQDRLEHRDLDQPRDHLVQDRLRIRLTFMGPTNPRSVVTSTMPTRRTSRLASRGLVSGSAYGARSFRTVRSRSSYGREARTAACARRILDAATSCIARVTCWMFLMLRTRRRSSRSEGTR